MLLERLKIVSLQEDEVPKRYGDVMKGNNKYHGFLALPRHAKILRQDLGFHLFNLYIAFIMEARWHRNNPQIGCVIGTQAEIASHLGVNQSTISRGIDVLYRKNKYYAVKHKKYVKLGFFPLFLADVAKRMAKSDYANLNELYADMYRINAELQDNYAISQEKLGKNPIQRLYSFHNVNLDSSQDYHEELDIGEVTEGLEKQKKEKESYL